MVAAQKNDEKTFYKMRDIKRGIKKLVRHAEISEKAIEAYLVRKVTAMGGECLKFTSHTDTGYPDRLLLLPGGKTIWVEVKSKGEKPRLIQDVRMARLRRMGFRVYVADSREKVDEIVRAAAEPLHTEKGEDDGVQTV